MFTACILRKKEIAKSARDIKPMIWTRLKCWEEGKYCALVREVEDSTKEDGWETITTAPFNIDSAGRK